MQGLPGAGAWRMRWRGTTPSCMACWRMWRRARDLIAERDRIMSRVLHASFSGEQADGTHTVEVVDTPLAGLSLRVLDDSAAGFIERIAPGSGSGLADAARAAARLRFPCVSRCHPQWRDGGAVVVPIAAQRATTRRRDVAGAGRPLGGSRHAVLPRLAQQSMDRLLFSQSTQWVGASRSMAPARRPRVCATRTRHRRTSRNRTSGAGCRPLRAGTLWPGRAIRWRIPTAWPRGGKRPARGCPRTANGVGAERSRGPSWRPARRRPIRPAVAERMGETSLPPVPAYWRLAGCRGPAGRPGGQAEGRVPSACRATRARP